MSFDPLAGLKKVDEKLYNKMISESENAFREGVVPTKYKLLLAMAIDASHGAADGVTSLANSAMNAGATKDEFAEFLEVVHYVSGGGSIYTAAHGLSRVEGL